MQDVIDLVVFSWLSFCSFLAIYLVSKRVMSSILIVFFVFYIFFAIPLLFDLIFGKPDYGDKMGFQLASRDNLTSIIYCFYISIVPVIWWLTGRTRDGFVIQKINISDLILDNLKKIKPFLYILVLAPVLAVLLSPDPSVYLHYGAVVKEIMVQESVDYHKYVHILALLSILALVGLFLLNNRNNFNFLLLIIPWSLFDIWVQGKRAIVVIFLMLLLLSCIQKGLLKGLKLYIFIAISLFCAVLFSNFYQEDIRGRDNTVFVPFEVNYKNTRIDFGRDSVTKLAIFSELNPDQVRILDYRGQSLLFYPTMFVPRDIWPNKPWPYPIYVTSAVYLNIIPAKYIGWTTTTSWLEEAVANIGWIGLLIGPLVISIICRIGDSTKVPFIKVITIMVASLLITLPLSSFFPIFALWLLLVAYTRRKITLLAAYKT